MTALNSQFEPNSAFAGRPLGLGTPVDGWHAVDPARQRRMFCLLAVAWLINVFDLFLTQMAYNHSMLVEMNPVAALVLPYGPLATAVYKFALLIIGTSILWWYRGHALAEAASWSYALVCVFLCFWWHHFNAEIIPLWAQLDADMILSNS
jgi:hypothetical protein